MHFGDDPKKKIKKVSVMHCLQRRNDGLIFVITGVTFLVSNQVITCVDVLSISLVWYLNYSPRGRGVRGGGRGAKEHLDEIDRLPL